MLPHWQKSLLFLTLLGLCSAQNTYYIKPKPDDLCPGDPCYTLSEYADNNDFQNLTLNATLCFLPGNHTLEQTISVTNLMSLSLHGNSSHREVASRIICTWPAGFVFTGIAELHLSELAFISCGQSDGAAVNIRSVEQTDISGCIFQNNVNYNHSDPKNESVGGAIYAQNSSLTLTGNTYQNNTAVNGGALYVLNSTLSLTDNVLQNNFAADKGGALYVQNSTLTLTGNTYQNNTPINGLTDNVLQNNSAVDKGGAMYVQNSTLICTGNTYQNNTAVNGGALYVLNSALNLTDNLLQRNSAVDKGGALYVQNSTLTFTGNTYQNNTAMRRGAISLGDSTIMLTGNSTFQHNCNATRGGVFYVSNSTLTLAGNSTFQDNSADKGGVFYAYNSTITLAGNSTFLGNSANSAGGGLNVFQSNLSLTGNNTFQNNSATDQGGALFVYAGNVTFMNTDFSGSSSEFGGAIFLSNSNVTMLKTNTIRKYIATYGGGMYVSNGNISGTATFNNNSARDGGGAIYASASTFYYRNTSFINNSAVDGGGLLLSSGSTLYLQPNTQVCFINNHAVRNGGAIKIEEPNPITYCIINDNPLLDDECFFQIQAGEWYPKLNITMLNITIYFDNNTAEAGSDLYGGSLDTCKFSNNDNSSGEILDDIAITNNRLYTFSNPVYICTCSNNQTNCSSSYHPQPVYLGGILEIPVTVRERRNGAISANIRVKDHSNITIPESEKIRTIKASESCATLRYTIQSIAADLTQKMTLYVEGLCPPTEAKNKSNTLSVFVEILSCPPGFQLYGPQNQPFCICAKRLQQFTTTCLINNKTVLRAQNAEFWVGYDNESQGLILHPHCPFDYCTSQKTYLAVTDSDRQCNYNRTELLCGRCGKNLSLALGSSRCLQCSNSHLVLLAAFAFAGIVLVLLLFVLRLTVAAGTINGLIFYANIITVNSSIFFQPRKTNVLTVFIA